MRSNEKQRGERTSAKGQLKARFKDDANSQGWRVPVSFLGRWVVVGGGGGGEMF